MNQFLEFNIHRLFCRRYVGWLGEIERDDDRSVCFGDTVQKLIFLSRSLENHVESKLSSKTIGPQRVLFIQRIKNHWLTRCDCIC